MPSRKPRHKLRATRKQGAVKRPKQRKSFPGKFNSDLDGYVYDLSLDGCADQTGDCQTFNNYSGVRLGREMVPEIAKDAARQGEFLKKEDLKTVRDHYGAILEENNQGFVGVEYIKTKREYDKKWNEIEEEYAEFCEEGDGEDGY